jgi:hypothetical protein
VVGSPAPFIPCLPLGSGACKLKHLVTIGCPPLDVSFWQDEVLSLLVFYLFLDVEEGDPLVYGVAGAANGAAFLVVVGAETLTNQLV